jgi:6,7-dimethyl-8-ribityllumazine synthase
LPEYSGELDGSGLSLAVVVSRFNQFLTERLLEGAKQALEEKGVDAERMDVFHVPGAFELPLVAKRLAESGRYNAVVCLGAVLRGETPHFDYVAGEAARGIAQVALETGVPIAFGVVTANTLQQALDRAGGSAGNKGYDAAVTAIEMANLMRKMDSFEDKEQEA